MTNCRVIGGTLVCLALASLACVGSPGDGGGSSGFNGSGGATTSPGTGGATGSGGMVATGTGGAPSSGSGGASSGTGGRGDSAATGGSASGGSIGSGGTGTGGRGGNTTSSGGRPGSGGSLGTGGTSGGTGGAAGASPPPKDPIKSVGCGSGMTVSCSTSGMPCKLTAGGIEREFYVVLPTGYDTNRPYPVVFQFHPLGGNAEQGMNMYRVRPNFPNAIYVTPNGLVSGSNRGFPNTNGQDEAMVTAIIADIEAKYCVDKARYFATGFSYGGSMSYTMACNMSTIFRGIAAMSGAPISGAKCTTRAPERPVAVWGTHGTADTALPIDLALPIRDVLVKKNGCSTTTHAVTPSPCVEYDGCMDGYPVVWCQREGDGHAIPSFSPTAIATFFQRF